MTYDAKAVAVDAVAPDTDSETDVAVEEVAAEEVAPEEVAVEDLAPEAPTAEAAEAAEKRFPKVIKRDEEASITHYSPKPHTELDPSTRFKD